MIWNRRHNQIVHGLRHPVGDNVSLLSQCKKPLVYRRPVCRDLAPSIVMVAGADCNASYLCQFADPSTDLPRLRDPRLLSEHIQQVFCYADQIITRTLLNQPTKPMLTKMKICRDKNFHTNGS